MVPLHDYIHAFLDLRQYRVRIACEFSFAYVERSHIYDDTSLGKGVVGLTELESVTSCVSSRRSNQLSYKPLTEAPRLRNVESIWSPKSTVTLLESKWRPELTAVNL